MKPSREVQVPPLLLAEIVIATLVSLGTLPLTAPLYWIGSLLRLPCAAGHAWIRSLQRRLARLAGES